MPEIEKTKESATAVALLIDGENLTPDAAGWLVNRASTMGPLRFRLVFGNAGRMPGWAEAPGFRLIHTGVGKNSADMALVIEAMALAYGKNIDRFAIATSDGDFSHLAHHLREKGHRVLGLGEAKAPPHFRRACTEFQEYAGAKPQIIAPAMTTTPSDKALRGWVVTALSDASNELTIQKLGPLISRTHGVRIASTPHKNWRRFLEKYPADFQCDPTGPDAKVRLVKKAA